MPDDEERTFTEHDLRQGSFFPCWCLSPSLRELIPACRASESARQSPLKEDDLLVILTQDCDLTSSEEKNLEVLPARRAKKKEKKSNDALRGARNTRKLHLPFDGDFWVCRVENISIIPKSSFEEGADWPERRQLDSQALEILLTWRVNRYTRKPLPGHFNDDFLTGYLRVEARGLTKFLADHRKNILDLYVFVEPDEEDAPEYHNSVTVLVCEGCSDEDFQEIEQTIERHLTSLHTEDNRLRMMQIDSAWIPADIQHTLEIVVRPEEFTLQDVFAMKRLTVDYLCFPED